MCVKTSRERHRVHIDLFNSLVELAYAIVG